MIRTDTKPIEAAAVGLVAGMVACGGVAEGDRIEMPGCETAWYYGGRGTRVLSTPARVGGGVVGVVSVGARPNNSSSRVVELIMLDARSGAVVDSVELSESQEPLLAELTVLPDGTIVSLLPEPGGLSDVLFLRDGETQWRRSERKSGTLGAASDGTVYLITGSGLTAISPDGSTAWETPSTVPPPVSLGMAIGEDGIIYHPCLQCDSTRPEAAGPAAFDPETGDVLWIAEDEYPNDTYGAFAIDADGSVYVTSDRSGTRELLEISSDGSLLTRHAIDQLARETVVSQDGVVTAEHADGGSWQVRLGEGPVIEVEEEPKSVALLEPELVLVRGLSGSATLYDYRGERVWRCGDISYRDPIFPANGVLLSYSRDQEALFALTAPVDGIASAPWPIWGHDLGHSFNAAF